MRHAVNSYLAHRFGSGNGCACDENNIFAYFLSSHTRPSDRARKTGLAKRVLVVVMRGHIEAASHLNRSLTIGLRDTLYAQQRRPFWNI